MPENIYNLKIFRWLNRETVEKIIYKCNVRVFENWWIIMEEWEESNWEWYIIKSWNIQIDIWWKKIAELWAWDIVGELSLLNEEKRSATAKAISDVEAIILTFNDLIEMINNDENNINKEIIRRMEENLENE